MQAFLTPFVVWNLFKILRKDDLKYYFYYSILAMVLFNLHYFEIIFLFSNFIFASIYFVQKKEYKKNIKFFISNFIALIAFLPFFIYASYSRALLISNFNNWIPKTNLFQIAKCMKFLFGGIISFVLSSGFFLKSFYKKRKNKRDFMIIYCYFTIFSTILISIILSYLIRPMLIERYLVLLIPIFIIFVSLIFTSKYKKKSLIVLFIFWFLLIQNNVYEKNYRKKNVFDVALNFVDILQKDFEKNNVEKRIYFLSKIDKDNLKLIKDIPQNEKVYYKSSNDAVIKEDVEKYLKNDNSVIFTTLTPEDGYSPKAVCYFNSVMDSCLWRID